MNGIYSYWVSYRDGKGKDGCSLQGRLLASGVGQRDDAFDLEVCASRAG